MQSVAYASKSLSIVQKMYFDDLRAALFNWSEEDVFFVSVMGAKSGSCHNHV